MKYIRTENHIYLIQKDISYGGNRIYKIYNHDFSIIGNDFKVADTIEELCDEFVGVDNSDNKPYRPFIIYGRSLEELNERQSCNESVFGAVWTSKGLIYVAKMDESGDLELI